MLAFSGQCNPRWNADARGALGMAVRKLDVHCGLGAREWRCVRGHGAQGTEPGTQKPWKPTWSPTRVIDIVQVPFTHIVNNKVKLQFASISCRSYQT